MTKGSGSSVAVQDEAVREYDDVDRQVGSQRTSIKKEAGPRRTKNEKRSNVC